MLLRVAPDLSELVRAGQTEQEDILGDTRPTVDRAIGPR